MEKRGKQKEEEQVIALINKEPAEKQAMLRAVYYNNLAHARIGELGRVIEVMISINRKLFVTEQFKELCYKDEPLPIGFGQTISQPSTVARMLLLAQLESGQDVLEIGAGSGWNAALIARLVKPGNVIAVERIKELSEMAKRNIEKLRLKLKNVKIIFGDALDRKGEAWKQSYDRMITTAGAGKDFISDLHSLAKRLLKAEGLLVYPTREAGSFGALEVWKLEKRKLIKLSREEGYSFVPLLRGKELRK